MQILEIPLTVSESGSLCIPPGILAEMGLGPGSRIHIAYLTRSGRENTNQEFFLSPDGMEHIREDPAIQIPNALLKQAGFDDGDDIKILCLDGCILICRDTEFHAESLREISEQLGRAEELTAALPLSVREALTQLSDFIGHFEERGEDELC